MAYVLIVDDDEDLCYPLAVALREAGYEVEFRLSTEEGKRAIAERTPDLIILDVMFPENVNAGFEMAREIPAMGEKYRDIPVLMLTAVNQTFPYGFSKDDIDADWLPITDFIEKPAIVEELQEKVADLLKSSRRGTQQS